MKKTKANIKRVIKTKLAHVINNKPLAKPVLKDSSTKTTEKKRISQVEKKPTAKPIVKNVVKPKPVIVNELELSRMSQEYKETQSMGRSKREKTFYAGNPNYSKPEILKPKPDEPVILRDYGNYVLEKNVDYDVIICVCTYNRYDKVRRILKQLFTQNTKYKFKILLMDDCSPDLRYSQLQKEFSEIDYMRNEFNGGKIEYWKTVNKLWAKGSLYKCHAFLQIDDDFILCEEFLNRLLDKFFEIKAIDNGYMVFSYHIYGYKRDEPQPDWWYNGSSIAIDGGTLFDNRFLKFFRHYVNIGNKVIAAHTSTFFWDTIVGHIRKFGVKVYRMPKSLAWHDGNFDSKLNFEARKTKKSYTKNFIDGDDKYDKDRDLSDVNFD